MPLSKEDIETLIDPKVQIMTMDGSIFEISLGVAWQCSEVWNELQVKGLDSTDKIAIMTPILAPHVVSPSMKSIILWCEYHVGKSHINGDESSIRNLIASEDLFISHFTFPAMITLFENSKALGIGALEAACCRSLQSKFPNSTLTEIGNWLADFHKNKPARRYPFGITDPLRKRDLHE